MRKELRNNRKRDLKYSPYKNQQQNKRHHSLFYPGSIWVKRISKLALLYAVGFNLFINDVQNTLYKAGESMYETSNQLSKPANDIAHVVEENVIPAVQYVETSPRILTSFDMVGLTFPSSDYLRHTVNNTKELKRVTTKYGGLYKGIALFLAIANWLFWIPISIAAAWIYLDIQRSTARNFDLLAIAIAIVFNVASYQALSSNFGI